MTNQEAINILWSMVEYKGYGQADFAAAQKAVKALTTVGSLQEELDQYKTLDEQGLLIKLPCKVGGYLYEVVNNSLGKGILDWEVTGYVINNNSLDVVVRNDYNGMGKIGIYEIGKNVFLTREEAEKRLAELEGEAR